MLNLAFAGYGEDIQMYKIHFFMNANFRFAFSVACEGEVKRSKEKLTFLAEASPESKMNFSKQSAEKLIYFYK
jgi:hypothetical protein